MHRLGFVLGSLGIVEQLQGCIGRPRGCIETLRGCVWRPQVSTSGELDSKASQTYNSRKTDCDFVGVVDTRKRFSLPVCRPMCKYARTPFTDRFQKARIENVWRRWDRINFGLIHRLVVPSTESATRFFDFGGGRLQKQGHRNSPSRSRQCGISF